MRWVCGVFFPEKCVTCRKEGAFLCSFCASQIEKKKYQVCPVCYSKSLFGKVCKQCVLHLPEFSHLIVGAEYSPRSILGKLLKKAKYASLGDVYTYLPQKCFDEVLVFLSMYPDIVLVPIPTAAATQKQRGVEHTCRIATLLARHSSVPIFRGLRKHKRTRQQAMLSREQRRVNLKNAFCLTVSAQGKHLLLVDDVGTTLSTLRECARTLLDGGAKRIDCFVLGRGS